MRGYALCHHCFKDKVQYWFVFLHISVCVNRIPRTWYRPVKLKIQRQDTRWSCIFVLANTGHRGEGWECDLWFYGGWLVRRFYQIGCMPSWKGAVDNPPLALFLCLYMTAGSITEQRSCFKCTPLWVPLSVFFFQLLSCLKNECM